MSGRDDAIAAFLAAEGCGNTPPALLAGDASFRRYYRVTRNQEPLVLMDAPPADEDVRPFVAVARHLLGEGFSAPRIVAADLDAGLLLLEDLGDGSFNRLIDAASAEEATLYAAAIDALVALQSKAAPALMEIDQQERHALPAYDVELLLAEAALFTDWYLPALSGRENNESSAALADMLAPLLQPLLAEQPVLVLRDYHADNLMWLAKRSGIQRVGLLDFQDAVIGHRAYDLVSLLQDARRDVPEDLEAAMIERYLAAVTTGEAGAEAGGEKIDPDDFRRAYALLGVQRNAKIIGIFTRLWKRDKKPGYLAMIPRVWGLLERSLKHEDFAGLRAYFNAAVPPETRSIAPTTETMPR